MGTLKRKPNPSTAPHDPKPPPLSRVQEQFNALTHLRRQFQHITIEQVDNTCKLKSASTCITFSPPDPIIHTFASISAPPIPFFNVNDYKFVESCTPIQMAILGRFDHPGYLPGERYLGGLGDAVYYTADLMKLDRLVPFPGRGELEGVGVKEGFAGVVCLRKDMKVQKGMEVAVMEAEEVFGRLMEGQRVEIEYARLGGRGAVVERGSLDAKMAVPAVGRLEFTPSYRDLRLTAITARRVMDAYAGGEFPIAVRRGMLSGGSEKIWKRFARYDRFLHFKVRDFDSSINPWMVRVAINMLREQIFEGTEKTYDAYFDFVYEGLVNTKIFRDDGLFLRKHVGTAYGHPWNTLVQSTILLFLGYASVRLLHPEMPMSEFAECVWVEALEGDMLMGLKGRLAHCTVEEVAEVARRAFAVEWLSEESFSTNAFTDLVCGELRGVKFLDWRWYDGDDEEEIVLPYQHARDKFVQLLFPDDGVPCDKTKTYLRVLAHYLGAAGNRAMELWLQELMDWIGFDGDCPNWPLKMRPLLEPYFGLLSTVPAPLRMTFAQWRDLVTMEKKEYQAVWPNHFWHAMR